MNHFSSWIIKDKYPEIPLDEMKISSEKIFSLWSRNINNINIKKNYAVNVIGALDTLEALDYHYNNYIQLKNSEDDINQKHELSAYLNRVGQLFYFTTSNFVKEFIPEPLKIMSKVDDLKIFRMKNTAHRSVDYPKKGETPEIQRLQAISLLGFTLYLNIKGEKKRYLFPSNSENGLPKCHYFTPEIDHKKILEESYCLMKLLIEKLT